ncbi:MAG: CPBP family glutamic-type intramembrane protease [Bacteroidota bacterium]
MVFVQTEFYKAWEAYDKAIKGHRFYEFGHLIIILFLYELLLAIFFNPKVVAYNGVDMWFKVSTILPGMTAPLSIYLIARWGWKLWHDYRGKKTDAEVRKDLKEMKKNKNFKPKGKPAWKKTGNWYYFGMMVAEGFVYGSLLIMLLPNIIYFLLSIVDPQVVVPATLDASNSLAPYHTSLLLNVGLAFGAGFYEEVIFRGLLFLGLARLAAKTKFFKGFKTETQGVGFFPVKIPKFKRDSGVTYVVCVAAVIYAFSHYVYPFGDTFSLYSFFNRFFFGVIMYIIFANRRLPIVAWTHVFYDIWYFVLL